MQCEFKESYRLFKSDVHLGQELAEFAMFGGMLRHLSVCLSVCVSVMSKAAGRPSYLPPTLYAIGLNCDALVTCSPDRSKNGRAFRFLRMRRRMRSIGRLAACRPGCFAIVSNVSGLRMAFESVENGGQTGRGAARFRRGSRPVVTSFWQ